MWTAFNFILYYIFINKGKRTDLDNSSGIDTVGRIKINTLSNYIAEPTDISILTEECMTRSNLDSLPLLKQAKENAANYYKEFRKVIPPHSLSGYASHCWKGKYTITWTDSNVCTSVVGNTTLSSKMCKTRYVHSAEITPYIRRTFPQHKYASNIVCLPNVFVEGFQKCGSTFFYHFVNNLVSMSIKDTGMRQIHKEPHFFCSDNVQEGDQLGIYLLNFVPGIQKIAKFNKTNIPLIDGTPNSVTDLQTYKKGENNLTNYCIIPVVLPRLLPDSKYIFVMRNPMDMVYSGFYYSCTDKLLRSKLNPDIFHQRVMTGMATFTNCMKDISEPSISEVCRMENRENYSSCIRQRLHLLDKCSAKVKPPKRGPHCGEIRFYTAIYYVHVRKWMDLVERDRLLFFTLEEMKVHADQVSRDIVQFLDLDPNIVTKENVMKATKVKDTKSRKYPNMREDTKSALEIFYHPLNVLLADILGHDKFKWF